MDNLIVGMYIALCVFFVAMFPITALAIMESEDRGEQLGQQYLSSLQTTCGPRSTVVFAERLSTAGNHSQRTVRRLYKETVSSPLCAQEAAAQR